MHIHVSPVAAATNITDFISSGKQCLVAELLLLESSGIMMISVLSGVV
jgi:hypothetical protein